MIHNENLQLYLRVGLKLKIHRVLKWLKPYIEFNTQERIEAKNNSDNDGKALHKLMSNSISEKAMENVRNRLVKLVNTKKDYLKSTSKPSHISHKIFDNNLAAICKSKVTLKLNRPAYIRMCILQLSKILMYRFHYHYIKNKYDNKSKL